MSINWHYFKVMNRRPM